MTPRRRKPLDSKWYLVFWALWILQALSSNSPHRFDFLIAGLMAGLGVSVFAQLANLWHLLFGRVVGHAVVGLSIGSGVRLATWRVGGRPVSLRWLLTTPLMADLVLVRQAGQKLRLWVSVLLLTAAQFALGVWLVATVPWGWALGGAAMLMTGLSLTLGAVNPMTPGWILFRLPFLPTDALDGYALTPAELAATRALRNGRVAEARAALEGAEPSFQTHLLRATVAIAEGRYADASTGALHAIETTPHPKAVAPAHFLRAAALVGAAENGELPPTEYLPWLDRAVAAGQEAGRLTATMASAAADLALLEGRPDDARKLARSAARKAVDPFWQAQAECTHAAALAAASRPDEARAALERARRAMPELARIETVATLTGLAEVTTGRSR